MPKSSDPCAALIDGERCASLTEVLIYCRPHWRQQNRGAPFSTPLRRRPRGMVAMRDERGRKQCAHCLEWLVVGEFGPAASATDGLQSWCSSCSADYMMLTRYGLDRAATEAMLEAQGGCAICGTRTPRNQGFRNGWAVDHDHSCCPSDRTCGQCIRGILCSDCNKVLGMAQDDPARLRAAADYLER